MLYCETWFSGEMLVVGGRLDWMILDAFSNIDDSCSGNAKSQPETVIEHLMERQGQARRAQVQAMYLSDQRRWSQDPPLPRPHLRVGSGGKDVLLEIPAYVRPSKGKQFFSFVSVSIAAVFYAYAYLLQPKTLPPCYCCTSHPITALQFYVE